MDDFLYVFAHSTLLIGQSVRHLELVFYGQVVADQLKVQDQLVAHDHHVACDVEEQYSPKNVTEDV